MIQYFYVVVEESFYYIMLIIKNLIVSMEFDILMIRKIFDSCSTIVFDEEAIYSSLAIIFTRLCAF